eukprot:695432-Amphidinium_carterae.1
MPEWDELFTARIPTRAHVPVGARQLWAQCLAQAFREVNTYNDPLSWAYLLALPKMVLTSPDRGGKKHKRHHEIETRQRCRRWLEGERSSLWGVHRLRRKTNSIRESADPFLQRLERVQALVKEGLYQKAAAALHPGSVAEMSDQLLVEMKAKHPDARSEDEGARATLRSIHHTAALQAKMEDTLNAVQSFPKGSSAGPSGFRPQHIKDALVPGHRDEILRQLTGVTQLLLSGQVPTVCRSRLAGANLLALTKPQG